MLEQLESSTENSVPPLLKHLGKTKEEQLQKNQPAMELLKVWIEEEVTQEELKQRESYFEAFKQIVDSARMPGHKLYSQE